MLIKYMCVGVWVWVCVGVFLCVCKPVANPFVTGIIALCQNMKCLYYYSLLLVEDEEKSSLSIKASGEKRQQREIQSTKHKIRVTSMMYNT